MNTIKTSLKNICHKELDAYSLRFAEIATTLIDFPHDLHVPEACHALPVAGLPFPPILVHASGERYVILDGCKRFISYQTRKDEKCSCCIVEPSPDPQTAGMIRVQYNRNRTLSVREKVCFLAWMKTHTTEQEYLQEAGSMGIGARERYELEQLFACPESVIDAVETGKVDAGVVSELMASGEEDRAGLIDFFSALCFSRQTQREFIEWLPEIAFRTNRSLGEIIDKEAAPIIGRHDLNPPQRIQKLREHIYKMRFPLYEKALEQWKKEAARINPAPGHIRFEPSPGFEKDHLEILVTVSDSSQASSIFERLRNIPREQWKHLISPFSEDTEQGVEPG